MCGIAGIVNSSKLFDRQDADALKVMCDLVRHRGPDDEGIHFTGRAGLGMRRLSIIDIAGGHQPMPNEDRTIWVVQNGEIYNFRELRDSLESRGHRFRTQSDTEVLLHAYEEHGDDFPSLLNGMFAVAIWDSCRGRLLLARDRVGIKPLFYYSDGERLVFASEMRALIKSGLPLRLEVDRDALDLYFGFGHYPAPHTVYRRVRKLEPGSTLVLQDGRLHFRTYWEPSFGAPGKGRGNQAEDDLGQLLKEAAGRHLVSDVPVGAFLSGGIDSTAVVAAAVDAGARDLQTYSIGYEDGAYDESGYARAVADHLGCRHETRIVRLEDVAGRVDDIMGRFDEPFFDSSAIPTFLLSEFVSSRLKVVMSGDGGDELFAGYRHYHYLMKRLETESDPVRSPWVKHLAASVGSACRRVLRRSAPLGWDYSLPWVPEYKLRRAHVPRVSRVLYESYTRFPLPLRASIQRRYRGDASLSYLRDMALDGVGRTDQDALSTFDFLNYLPNDVLTKVDRMSMQHSLEVRVPLLDTRLLLYARSLLVGQKTDGTFGKLPLRRYLSKRLGTSEVARMVLRPKQGFRFPLAECMQGPMRAAIQDSLRCRAFHDYFDLDRSCVEYLLASCFGRRSRHGKPVWVLYCLYLWWHQTVAGRAPA